MEFQKKIILGYNVFPLKFFATDGQRLEFLSAQSIRSITTCIHTVLSTINEIFWTNLSWDKLWTKYPLANWYFGRISKKDKLFINWCWSYSVIYEWRYCGESGFFLTRTSYKIIHLVLENSNINHIFSEFFKLFHYLSGFL